MLESVGLLVWVLAAQLAIAICLRDLTRTRLLLALVILLGWSLGAAIGFPARFPDITSVALHAVAWIVAGARLITVLLKLRGAIDAERRLDLEQAGRLSRAAGRAAPWGGLAAALGLLLPAVVSGTSIGAALLAAGLMIATGATACLAGLSGKPRSAGGPAMILFIAAMASIVIDLS